MKPGPQGRSVNAHWLYPLAIKMLLLLLLLLLLNIELCSTFEAGALWWWLAPLSFTPELGARLSVSAVWKKQKMFLLQPRVKVSIVGSLRDREVACSASDRQGTSFESCVWRTVSSHSSHHSQEVLLAQFSLYVHKGGLKPDSFHFYHNYKLQVVEIQIIVVSIQVRSVEIQVNVV